MSSHGMNEFSFVNRVEELRADYQRMFEQRGGATPSDPIEYHLFHLALYWSRLVGFCRMSPAKSAGFVDNDLGVCVTIGSEYVNKTIEASQPAYRNWHDCWHRTQKVLYERPVALGDVEDAVRSFNEFLSARGSDSLRIADR